MELAAKIDIEMEADLPKLSRKDHAHQRAWGEDRNKTTERLTNETVSISKGPSF